MAHKRNISVIGLGYVGLPVAVAFAGRGHVIGFDINQSRIGELLQGVDNTNEVESAVLNSADVQFTSESADLKTADFHIIAVPTPINKAKQPDLGPVISASKTLGSVLKQGDIVVYESTVYPGATEEVCVPVLESCSGLIAGRDFFIGYSPERINPGDREHDFTRIKKVVSAQQPEILEIIAQIYGSVVSAGVHKAPTIKVAEAAKVIENTQRDLNISLMNELALIFDRLEIDTGDVLEAAGTKWNFLPFRPGLVGGHCIGVDPYYLTHKAEMTGYTPQVILAGRRINDQMGQFVGASVLKALVKSGEVIKDCTVTLMGFTFKENVPDTRNTRVIDIVQYLEDLSIKVQVFDPVAHPEEVRAVYGIDLVPRQELLPCHAVVMAVAHKPFIDGGWGEITSLLAQGKGIVFDVQRMLDRQAIPDGITLLRL